MNNNNFIVAIDGFSSCGKSTLAKQLAKHLNFIYVDSGAMYRAMTLHFLKNDVDISNENAVQEAVANATIYFKIIDGDARIFLNEEDVSTEIREMYVAEKVSKVSQLAAVRRALIASQQNIGKTANIIMDGRDIGTQVFPYANVKLFMTADPKRRAERRHLELCNSGKSATIDEVFVNLAQRDYDDTTRKESPLVCGPDAILIDNTDLSMDEQFQIALNIIIDNSTFKTLTSLA